MNSARTNYPRLEDQIEWYDRKSVHHQRWYRRLKVTSIAAAALVPLFSSLDDFGLLAGVLGVLVVVVEGLQHVNQHHENWIRYRATAENLMHEKYLYLARAGHYAGRGDDEAFRRLATSVEAILSREGEAWQQLLQNLEEQTSRPPQLPVD
ncbi:MAG: DUF4231 domain-containing protein [Gammaproteobacteria bacterium]|nr:DUF4231 domain-containing protein [Gammaproteobacteria bacterium]